MDDYQASNIIFGLGFIITAFSMFLGEFADLKAQVTFMALGISTMLIGNHTWIRTFRREQTSGEKTQ